MSPPHLWSLLFTLATCWFWLIISKSVGSWSFSARQWYHFVHWNHSSVIADTEYRHQSVLLWFAHPFWISDKTQWKQDNSEHHTASTCFYAFSLCEKQIKILSCSFLKEGWNDIGLHGCDSIKQAFHDPNCVCRPSGCWNKELAGGEDIKPRWSLLVTLEYYRDKLIQ